MVMENNQEESNQEENKNLSEYEKIWEEIRNKINVTAKQYVPTLYEALIKDGYTPKEAREKIKKDSINIWSEKTVDNYISEDAKEPIKVLAGKLGQEKKKDTNLLTQMEAEQSPVSQTKPISASISVPQKVISERKEEQKEKEPIEEKEMVWIELGMNDSKDLKKVLNNINLMRGVKFLYDLKTRKIVSIR